MSRRPYPPSYLDFSGYAVSAALIGCAVCSLGLALLIFGNVLHSPQPSADGLLVAIVFTTGLTTIWSSLWALPAMLLIAVPLTWPLRWTVARNPIKAVILGMVADGAIAVGALAIQFGLDKFDRLIITALPYGCLIGLLWIAAAWHLCRGHIPPEGDEG